MRLAFLRVAYVCHFIYNVCTRIYIYFLNTCQLKSRKYTAISPKANRIWPKEIHEKVSALNITTPLLERGPSRRTPRVRTRRFIRDALCAETPWLAIKKIRDGSSFRLFSRNVPLLFRHPVRLSPKSIASGTDLLLLYPVPLHTERVYVIPFRTAGRERYALRSVCLRFLTAKMRPRNEL